MALYLICLILVTLLPDIYFRMMNMSNFSKHIYLSGSREVVFLPEGPIERLLWGQGGGGVVRMMLEQVRHQLGSEATDTLTSAGIHYFNQDWRGCCYQNPWATAICEVWLAERGTRPVKARTTKDFWPPLGKTCQSRERKYFPSPFFLPSDFPNSHLCSPLVGPSPKPVVNRAGKCSLQEKSEGRLWGQVTTTWQFWFFEGAWRDGIEIRFKALISWEGLCLHDIIERLLTLVLLTGIKLLIFFILLEKI